MQISRPGLAENLAPPSDPDFAAVVEGFDFVLELKLDGSRSLDFVCRKWVEHGGVTALQGRGERLFRAEARGRQKRPISNDEIGRV